MNTPTDIPAPAAKMLTQEPTEAMSDAGAHCIRDTFKATNQYSRAQQIFRAMWDAAPASLTPPVTEDWKDAPTAARALALLPELVKRLAMWQKIWDAENENLAFEYRARVQDVGNELRTIIAFLQSLAAGTYVPPLASLTPPPVDVAQVEAMREACAKVVDDKIDVLRRVDQILYQTTIPTTPGPTQAFKDAEALAELSGAIRNLPLTASPAVSTTTAEAPDVDEGEVRGLEWALTFYANPLRYQGPNSPPIEGDKYQHAGLPYRLDVTRDGGEIARKALAALSAMKEQP